jgi:hypothetical protein
MDPDRPTPGADENLLLRESFGGPALDGWTSYVGGENERIPSWKLERGALLQPVEDTLIRAILTGDAGWRDYSIAARIQIHSAYADSRAGLVFRDDGRGFYVLRFTKSSGRAQLMYHCRSPFGWHELATVPVNGSQKSECWVSVKVEVRGPFIRCFVGGNQYIDLADSRSRSGRLGFYACEARASFADLEVRRLVTAPMPPSWANNPPFAPTVSFWFRETFTDPGTASWDLPSGWRVRAGLCIREGESPGSGAVARLTGAPFSDGLAQVKLRALDVTLDEFDAEMQLLMAAHVERIAEEAGGGGGQQGGDRAPDERHDRPTGEATHGESPAAGGPDAPEACAGARDAGPDAATATPPARPVSTSRAGIVLRGRDQGYYAFLLARSQSQLILVNRDDASGKEEVLGHVEFRIPPEDRWYRLAVQCRRDALVALIDGIPCIAVQDPKRSIGYVGLFADGGPVVFTDLLAASAK